MKCPQMYSVIQQNIRRPILNEDMMVRGEYHLLIETQQFGNCHKEECAYWNKEKNMCGKVE